MYAAFKKQNAAEGRADDTSTMASITDRCVGAVVGAIVGDAAARPTHWVYAIPKMDEFTAKHPNPEFPKENFSPFYNIPTGEQSCYGDQVYALTWSLADSKGWNKEDYKKKLYDVFGPGTDYDVLKKLGRKATKEDNPIPAHWRHHSIIHFLEQYEAGSDDTGHDDSSADGLAKTAPMVVLYAGDPNLVKYVEEMVRVTQANDLAVKCAVTGARILERYILKGADANAITNVRDSSPDDIKDLMQKALDVKSKPHQEVCKLFGSNCANPQNLQNMIQCLSNSDGNFTNTLRYTMTGTGDNCGRCNFVGACMGAQVGIQGIPQDWIKQTHAAGKAMEFAEQIAALRK